MSQDKVASFFYLKIFLIFVALVILGAIIYRVGCEITNSTFKNNTFSLLMVSKDSKLIFVDKNAKTALFLALGDIAKYVKGKNTLEASFALGIPINGMIIDKKVPLNLSDFTSTDSEIRLLLGVETSFKNLNRYDIVKIINAVREADRDNKTELRIDLFDQKGMKSKLEEGFTDSLIRNSSLTVEIDNGTTINGLGSILALILAKEGYNVIAVRTAPSEIASYISYPGDSNLYISSIEGLTGFSVKKTKSSQTADVTIFLGDDVDAMLSP